MCWNSITSTSFIGSSASYGPLDYTLQNVWLWVIDHTIMVIKVIKTFFFFNTSSVYSFHLFLISSASVRSLLFLSFIWPVFTWNTSLCCCCWCSVTQSCPTLCNSIDCSTPGFPVLHHLPGLAQTHAHWVGDVTQPSHPLVSLGISSFLEEMSCLSPSVVFLYFFALFT